MTHLLCVAAPNGVLPNNTALIRVLIVPRLEAGVLSDFGLDDWPATLRDTTVKVRIKTSAGEKTIFVGMPLQAARSDVWHAFFGGAASNVNPPSLPVPAVPVVRDTHKTAVDVTKTHKQSTVELATLGADPDILERNLRDRITAWHVPDDPPSSAPNQTTPPALSPDFHQAVALLREHPAVLRDLGLIFEIAIDPAKLGVGDDDKPRHLAVEPASPLPIGFISPWTRYELATRRFWPAPADARAGIRHGILDLSEASLMDPDPAQADPTPPRWAIATFDIEGAEQSLRAAAKSLVDDPGRPAALPGLRSAGLLLIRPGWQGVLQDRVASAADRTAAEDDQHLTAEDLTAGYRVDIRGEDAVWRSLCRRSAAYSVKEQDSENVLAIGGSPRVFEEGHVRPFSAIRRDDGRLHTDEVVLRWDGWSLVLPRMHPLQDRPHATRQSGAAELPYDFRADYLRPGEQSGTGVSDDRLPPLRFSHRYQMRIRIADVTGGGPAPGDVADNATASQEITYARHDPVAPPVLGGAGDVFTPGAGIDRLVLRSDWHMTAKDFVAAEPRYASLQQRTLQPPTVSFETAEQHGIFDAPDEQKTLPWAQLAIQPDQRAGLPDPAAEGVNAFVPAAPGGLSTSFSDHSPWQRPWPSATPKFLQLVETDDGEPVSLHWDADTTLVVGLAKGERAVLELSSRVVADMLDHFAWFNWLSDDAGRVTFSTTGRNPATTPPRRIELVHAMRTPRGAPNWQLPPPMRGEHDTTALLKPTFTSLDTDTTGRIEISATWREWSDSGDADAPAQLVHAQTVAPGAPPTPIIRHEFGDTKHRWIHYTIKAISRYRPYFFEDEPDAAFEVQSPQTGPVNILSTARPAPLVLKGVAPSFQWQTDTSATRIERVRSPRIRVEVAPPWYETGEGESLGVIAAAQGTPSEAITPWLSEIGRDPIFASSEPARFPTKASFTAASAAAFHRAPSEIGEEVEVVPHAVTRGDDCWFADVAITMPSQASYMPFVKLALARHQPDSLDGLWLSPIVTTDLVPLLPERRLVVERGSAVVQVTLTGPGPNPPNRYEVIMERCEADAPPDFGEGGLVVVGSEEGGIPAWAAAGAPTTADVGATAVVALPDAPARARLRIREIENLDAPTAPTAPADPAELRQRSVYFDVVDLPSGWLVAEDPPAGGR